VGCDISGARQSGDVGEGEGEGAGLRRVQVRV
jgi:hypothetical protein